MHLIRLEATNYRLHSRLIVDFDAMGSFTVTGPNGTGKSSFSEAILYAFYGYHRSADTQGPAANRIVKIGQQACAVTLDFSASGVVYRIVRKRRSVGRGSSELELYRVEADGSRTALSDDDSKATQKLINRVVPAVSTLLATNFVKQKDAARFPNERPAGRKAVLRSIFQIEEFRTMAKEARAKVAGAEERAAAYERGAVGLEAEEARIVECRALVEQHATAERLARDGLAQARAAVATAAEERAKAEERAAQAARLQAERAAQAAHVAALQSEAHDLRLQVARLQMSADPETVAAGQRAAADLPALLERIATARAALVQASERCATARGLDESAQRLQQRLDALALRAAAPLPDLEGRTEAEVASAAETLTAARAALVEATTAADAHRASARDLARLEERLASARARLEAMPKERSDLAELEARAAGVAESRTAVSALAGQVAELTSLRNQRLRQEDVVRGLDGRLRALPAPDPNLPELERVAAELEARRGTRDAATSELERCLQAEREAQSELASAREVYSGLAASLKAAELAAGEAANAGCATAPAWVAPGGQDGAVDLFALCPLSAAAARNRAALPELRDQVAAATTRGTAARQAYMDTGAKATDARESVAAAQRAVGEAEAAKDRLEALRTADAQRIALEAEIATARLRVEEIAGQILALADVESRHLEATTRQRQAEQALDDLGRERANIEARRERAREVDGLAAEVGAARAGVEGTASTLAQETDARAAAARGERAADLLARFRSALEARRVVMVEADEVRTELATVSDRRSALGDVAAERASQERLVPELEAQERTARASIESGRNAERAAADLVTARAQADAAAGRASEAAKALEAMPTGEDGAAKVEAARRAEEGLRATVHLREQEADAASRAVHVAEADLSAVEGRCQMMRQARQEAHTAQAEAAAWSRTAETCELAPTLIIEQSIAQLEAETNAVLERISSRGLRLRLETQRALASGDEMAETLDILIDYDVGTLTYEDLSGGEQTRIDMALRVGLSRLLAGGQHVDFLILDEGWGDLDPEGVDTLREVVAGLQTIYANVILVTHKEVLFGMFGRRLHFEHSDEGSTCRVL